LIFSKIVKNVSTKTSVLKHNAPNSITYIRPKHCLGEVIALTRLPTFISKGNRGIRKGKERKEIVPFSEILNTPPCLDITGAEH